MTLKNIIGPSPDDYSVYFTEKADFLEDLYIASKASNSIILNGSAEIGYYQDILKIISKMNNNY